MTTRDLLDLRLSAHLLSAPATSSPSGVVGRFGAMQAQEVVPSRLSIGQRIAGGTEAMVDAALADGDIVRTHALRPTWHYLAAADLRWIQHLTAPRVHAMNASRYRELGLDGHTLARGHRLVAAALEGGRHLTRGEIRTRLEAEGFETRGQRLAHLMMHAELECLVCSGPVQGRRHTYALADERVPAGRALDRDDALAELAVRYFTTRGPATERDFRWWSSLLAADARAAIEGAGDRLAHLRVGDRVYWLAAEPARPPARGPAALLLQVYDEYIVAYTESRDLLGRDPLKGQRGRLRYLYAAFHRGRTIGRCRPEHRQDAVEVELEPFGRFSGRRRAAIAAAVARYGRFIGRAAAMTLSTASTGPG